MALESAPVATRPWRPRLAEVAGACARSRKEELRSSRFTSPPRRMPRLRPACQLSRSGVTMRKVLLGLSLALVALLAAGHFAPLLADPGRGANVLCYVWANDPSPAIGVAYTPSTIYSYNAVGRSQANSVRRTATGTYVVTCQGVGGGPLFKPAAPTGADDASAESTAVSTDEVAGQQAEAGAQPTA